MVWDLEVDLLVAGSGAGGLTAALVAANECLSVVLCEKSPRLGGTTATSGGGIWIPLSSQAVAAGVSDDPEAVRLYLRGELGEYYRQELVEAFLTSGPEALDYLRRHTEVRFDLADIPDYHSDAPGGVRTGRTLMATAFDGRRLGDAFETIQPPMRRMMVLGGMMFSRREVFTLLRPLSSWQAFRTTTGLLLRYLSDRLRHSRGTRLLIGNALVARYVFSLRALGVPLWTRAPLRDLIVEDGRVVGAVVDYAGGLKRVRVRRGVVLATGGVARDPELLRELTPGFPHEFTLAHEGDTGDALTIARRAAGAAADTHVRSAAVWTPASLFKESDGSLSVMTYGYLDRGKPGAIIVNPRGERFVNEANSYHDVVLAMFDRQAEDGLTAHLICDSDFIHDYGLGVVPPYRRSVTAYVRRGYLQTASTLDDLARKIGVDPQGLRRTVDDHNAYARTGKDLAFGKGETAFNRYNGDPHITPNPCLRPLQRAPFYALRVHPATIGASVGLKTNRDGRVLDTSDRPIAGLWAAGNDQTNVMAGCCPAAGVTLGPALVFGYRAARDAARQESAA